MMEIGSLLLCLKTLGSIPPGGKLGHSLDNSLFVAKEGLLSSAWRIMLGEGRVKSTDYRDDIDYKLGVTYTPDDDVEADVDMVPDGADPNADLENYISASDPEDTLAKRALTPVAGTGQKKDILAIIALWNIPQLDFGLKQKTLFTMGQYRIDQQSNGPFNKDYVDSNGNHFTVACYNVAVQAGGVVYASINVPAGEYITAGGIRKLLTASLNQGQVLSFVKAAKPRPHTWLAAIATGIMLIGGAVAL
ncbi:hypothetical protein WJX84_009931 [Apatococcus fuscideae]|uniref:Uncharacterized protein n=1 Tax=Apatococcus fuscideae TaxID=2026836 RepID=A0AAW1SMI1_9CHLO